MKPKSLFISGAWLLSTGVLATEASWIDQCQRSLALDQPFATQPGCNELLAQATAGDANSYYQLGSLLVDTKHPVRANKRLKRGLFYLLLAADDNHHQAIKKLSLWVKGKMQQGKIPLRYSHYVSYLEMDWQLQGKKADHHYAHYLQWLDTIEQTREAPHKQDAQTLIAMATDYENGYFLGANMDTAMALYKIAANQGAAYAQYKVGEILYPQDPNQALEYLHQAVANQSSDAMLKLAEHFGCKGDKGQAIKWYQRAINQGNEYASDEKDSFIQHGKPEHCNN